MAGTYDCTVNSFNGCTVEYDKIRCGANGINNKPAEIKKGTYVCPECKIILHDAALTLGLLCPNCRKTNMMFYSSFYRE